MIYESIGPETKTYRRSFLVLTVSPVHLSLQYMNNLTYLTSQAFSSIPPELVPDLQRMLSANATFRPTALDFTGKKQVSLSSFYYLLFIYLFIWIYTSTCNFDVLFLLYVYTAVWSLPSFLLVNIMRTWFLTVPVGVSQQ